MNAPHKPNRRLPILGQDSPLLDDINAEIARFEAEEAERLGVDTEPKKYWSDNMINKTIKSAEKNSVTLLLGGLPKLADILIHSALKPIGYSVMYLPEPDHESLRHGKEFGNRAQCNPTYYTVGNLVKFLCQLRDEGMSEDEIVSKYAFVSAGSCGPCRFGMYVTEYRKALRDAGFEGFRIMLFEEKGGFSQETEEDAGLEFTPKFFMQLGKAVYSADILNGLGYRLRPYEVNEGDVDRILADAKQICCETLERDGSILGALVKVRKKFSQLKIDRTVIKPKVAMMGEFWAQMTEGEGNYRVKGFLEGEGAHVQVQFVSEWLLYNVWEEKRDMELRVGMRGVDTGTARSQEDMGTFGVAKRRAGLWAADRGMRTVFQTFAKAAGYNDYVTGDVDKARVTAAEFYSSELRGGEGHMEVAHLVDNYAKKKANMTLSVKPFGCLPSSGVSDGITSKVLEKYPGAILASVETSGDGAVNFYSRVQLYLFKAREAAEKEVNAALEETGQTMEEVRAYIKKHPELENPLRLPPHRAACMAADMVYYVDSHKNSTRLSRARDRATTLAGTARTTASSARKAAPGFLKTASQLAREAGLTAYEVARAKLGLETEDASVV
jgi:predicted nucleotide-binding protein (sugar kinase/HSP70/actin superfamily)